MVDFDVDVNHWTFPWSTAGCAFHHALKLIKFIFQVETKDALLHAINEEFVEAVEVLLEHEETIHKEGEPHVSTIN